ncbi:MAG: enolase C-terminal domain-like protein [Luteolibacter sp.]
MGSDDPIFISIYRLRSRAALNAQSTRREFHGALIRVNGGYGCIHPWPELGDPSLERCLADLAGARRWPIVKRALRCAEYDRVARRFEHSLFEDMEIPESHATLVSCDAAAVADAEKNGFRIMKMKCGKEPVNEAAFVNQMAKLHPSLRWRLDCNESLDRCAVQSFVGELSEEARRAIDFIEDPCPYAESTWSELHRATRLQLAVDREAAPQSRSAQFMVIKPAIDEPLLLAEAAQANGQRVVVTSYMDHPLGQAFAAWEAARLSLQFPGLVAECGLQTHHLFEPDAFTDLLGDWTPLFQPPPGNGLGFDDLLDELPWSPLR